MSEGLCTSCGAAVNLAAGQDEINCFSKYKHMKTNALFRMITISLVLWANAPAQAGYSLSTRGGAYVVVPYTPSLNVTNNNITVECWFNCVAPPSGGDQWDSLVSNEAYTTSFSGWDLRFGHLSPYGSFLANPYLPDPAVAATTTNQWHHYAMEYNGTNFLIWVDGNLGCSNNFVSQLVNTVNPISIGCQNSGWREFNGYIAEVRISNISRYTGAFSPQTRFANDSHTVALYHFDEGQGTIVADSSGNGHNGTIQGAGAWSLNVPTNAPPPPNIISQPLSQSVNQGSPVSFSVIATGTNLNYQWRLNSGGISGATNSSYNLASATTNNAGNYTVIVNNAGGSVTSSNAVLTVIPPPRTGIGTALLTSGFVTSVSITDGGSGYTNTPPVRLIGGGSGATAVAVVSNGIVTGITVTDAGFGYTNAPLVVIEPPFILNPVLSIAPMSFLTFSNLTVSGVYQLQRSVAWYWTNQPLNFSATNSIYMQMFAGVVGSGDYRLALNPVPAQAFATAQMVNGFVVGATVTSGGSGYVTSPAVSITGGHGTNATAVSYLSGGVVTSISITSAGIGYTNTPTVQIAPPPAAAVSPTVQPVMRVDSASLAPYDNYQIQFKPNLGGTWGNWNAGLFSPTDVTNSQYLFITNGTGFFRLQFVP